MLWWTFLLQISFYLCVCLQDFIKIVRLLLAAVSINGLSSKLAWVQVNWYIVAETYIFILPAGLSANSYCYWPRRTSNTQDLLVLQNFYWPYKFFFKIKTKQMHKIHRQHLFLIISPLFISKTLGTFLRGTCPQMFTGPVGLVEVFFYLP